jgi:hypothetical protein
MVSKKKPPARDADGFLNVLRSPANVWEDNHPALVLQFSIRRFGVAPEVRATLAALAGLGPREVRVNG